MTEEKKPKKTMKINDELEDFQFRKMPDVSKEDEEIARQLKELEKAKQIIKEAEESKALKQRLELQQRQEDNLIMARKEIEQLDDQINKFKRQKAFMDNLSFIKNLETYYRQLQNYRSSDVYLTEEFTQFAEERELISKVRKWANLSLKTLGDRQHRELLLANNERIETIEKAIITINKTLKKIQKSLK